MKPKLNTLFISFAVLGIFFLSASMTPAREVAAEAALSGRQAPSNQAPRQTLAGVWKLNRAQSDDPTQKLVSDENIATGETGTSVPIAGQTGGLANVPPGGGNAGNISSLGSPPSGMGGIGGLGGPNGMGGGVPPMPATPPSHRWETDKDRQKRLEGLLPAGSITIEQKDNEFDFADDQSRKQICYTDGRKLRKSKDDKIQEFTARWDEGRLAYDEKRPPRGTITRTFELSPDGRQMTETMTIDNGSISVPVVLKYIYDAASASAQP